LIKLIFIKSKEEEKYQQQQKPKGQKPKTHLRKLIFIKNKEEEEELGLSTAMPHLVFHPHHLHPPFLSHHHPPLLRTQNPTAWIHSARPLGLLSLKPTIGSTIRCMANPRRVKMVAKQIRRELSDMLLTDKVLQYAILPEASLGADKYLSSLTTISDVEVSGDLQVLYAYFHLFFWVFFEYEL
jgi:hypothetical protein